MAKKRKNKREEEHMDESWLVPYADILTLLLALFIVLFASSSVDANKFQQLSGVFNQIFSGGSGVMDYPSPVPQSVDDKTPANDDAKNETDQMNEQEKLGQVEQKELEEIQNKVELFIKNNQLGDKLQTSLTSGGLLLTIRDNVLFDSGSAEIRKENQEIAKEISDLLIMNPPRSIVISGHTDNVPIKNARFDSNWDLSVTRAVNFMKILLENDGLNPKWFSAKGYGEYMPIDTNETAAARAKNRRVEILIVPRTTIQSVN